MSNKTSEQYDEAVADCKSTFLAKAKDYGTAWRMLRISSVADQIYIKAERIRTVDSKGTMKVEEGIDKEFLGIVNYGIIGLIQIDHREDTNLQLPLEEIEKLYDAKSTEAKKLMESKNHDYGEAWRQMKISSFTDLILVKILRINQIQTNDGKTIVSEGIEANFYDIINYAIFALIKIQEENEGTARN
ncbi:MAG: DUF1599 domain-containing protein [Bacteroidetes bacterium]|nr:DUF1599 domain-containing protein [Bacteroidota bacterium]